MHLSPLKTAVRTLLVLALCGATQAWGGAAEIHPATPSFDPNSPDSLLAIDFGDVLLDEVVTSVFFDVYNLHSPSGDTSTMSLESVDSLGDATTLPLTHGPVMAVPAGSFATFEVGFDTSVVGKFSVTYRLDFSSDLLPDEPVTSLALAVFGDVLSPADYNRDGEIDALDYQAWELAFGVIGSDDADGNGDGVVDAADYTVWRDALSETAGSSTLATVPEPTGVASITLLAILISARRAFQSRA